MSTEVPTLLRQDAEEMRDRIAELQRERGVLAALAAGLLVNYTIGSSRSIDEYIVKAAETSSWSTLLTNLAAEVKALSHPPHAKR